MKLLQIPVNKVQTYGDLRNVLMKRIFLSALHFRINTRYKVRLWCICTFSLMLLKKTRLDTLEIQGFKKSADDTLKIQSSNPPFTSIELDHSDSGREGCTVTTLTVTAEPKNWQSAIKVAVQEVCSLLFHSFVRKTSFFI